MFHVIEELSLLLDFIRNQKKKEKKLKDMSLTGVAFFTAVSVLAIMFIFSLLLLQNYIIIIDLFPF